MIPLCRPDFVGHFLGLRCGPGGWRDCGLSSSSTTVPSILGILFRI